MLGDRGTWFKMCFYERSARVPLVVAGPDVANRSVANACSLLDLFPTLLDVAGAGAEPSVPLAGRSLWPSATGGEDPVDETIGEYTAEMTSHPMFMIRRGRHKYIACETDPPLLYDVEADPLERTNLAADPAHASLAGRIRRRGGRTLGQLGDPGVGPGVPARPPLAARGHRTSATASPGTTPQSATPPTSTSATTWTGPRPAPAAASHRSAEAVSGCGVRRGGSCRRPSWGVRRRIRCDGGTCRARWWP